MWPTGDESSEITLTLTMNRLLLCLIEKNGQVLSRNELLDRVWDDYGLRSSSHTLNKYISELRKHFINLGIDEEVIITVPRVGFLFSGDRDISLLQEEKIGLQNIVTSEQLSVIKNSNEEDNENNTSDAAAPKLIWSSSYGYFIYPIIAAILFLTVSEYNNLEPHPAKIKKNETPLYFLFNYEGCPVYTLQKTLMHLRIK